MKSVVDYIVRLLGDIKSKEKRLEECSDVYEKVGHKYELDAMKEQLSNAANVLGNAFTREELFELCQGIMPLDVQKNIFEQVDAKNEENKRSYTQHLDRLIEIRQKDIETLFKEDSNCDKETSPIFSKYKSAQEAIKKARQNIEKPNYQKVNIFAYLGPEYYDKYIKKLADNLDKVKDSKDIEKNILSYQVVYKSEETLEYPVKDKLDQMMSKMSVSSDTYNLIKVNYDFINEITAIESNEGTLGLYDYVREIESLVEKTNLNIFVEGAKEKGVEDIVYNNANGFREFDNYETEKRVCNDDLKLDFSDNIKALYSTLLKEMQNTNMLIDDASIEESKDKEYGFTKFLNAKQKIIATINAEHFDEVEFRANLDDLKSEVEKIENIENLIEQNIGTPFESMTTNVDNYRNIMVPRRFKQNLVHNAQINGLYLSLAFVNATGVSIDEFIRNPTEVVKKAFEAEFNKLHIDNQLKSKDKAEAIFALAGGKRFEAVDVYGYIRALLSFSALESDPEKRKHNAVVIAGISTSFAKKKMVLHAGNTFMDTANVSETLQNILLAKPDKTGVISYADCHSSKVEKSNEKNSEFVSKMSDYKTGYSIKDKETAIDKISKIENFQETYYDMMDVIKKYNVALNNPNNKGVQQNIKMNDLITAAQELCAKYLLTHDIDELDKSFQRKAMNFIKNPSLEDTLSAVDTNNMENLSLEKLVKDKKRLLSKKEKDIKSFVNTQEKAFIKTFKELNKQMDALDKQVDKIASKIGKGETNTEIETIGMSQRKLLNQLMEAQNARIEGLQKEYEKGMISKYYFEKRVEQVKSLQNLDKIPPMFKSDDPKYKNFNTYRKNELEAKRNSLSSVKASNITEQNILGKSNEELLEEYNAVMKEARREKTIYLSDLVLSDNGIKTLKSLSSVNEFAVKSELIQINEQEYKKESDDLIKENEKIKQALRHQIIVHEVSDEINYLDTVRLNESKVVGEKEISTNSV